VRLPANGIVSYSDTASAKKTAFFWLDVSVQSPQLPQMPQTLCRAEAMAAGS
jgi:hypothetical protein